MVIIPYFVLTLNKTKQTKQNIYKTHFFDPQKILDDKLRRKAILGFQMRKHRFTERLFRSLKTINGEARTSLCIF